MNRLCISLVSIILSSCGSYIPFVTNERTVLGTVIGKEDQKNYSENDSRRQKYTTQIAMPFFYGGYDIIDYIDENLYYSVKKGSTVNVRCIETYEVKYRDTLVVNARALGIKILGIEKNNNKPKDSLYMRLSNRKKIKVYK